MRQRALFFIMLFFALSGVACLLLGLSERVYASTFFALTWTLVYVLPSAIAVSLAGTATRAWCRVLCAVVAAMLMCSAFFLLSGVDLLGTSLVAGSLLYAMLITLPMALISEWRHRRQHDRT